MEPGPLGSLPGKRPPQSAHSHPVAGSQLNEHCPSVRFVTCIAHCTRCANILKSCAAITADFVSFSIFYFPPPTLQCTVQPYLTLKSVSPSTTSSHSVLIASHCSLHQLVHTLKVYSITLFQPNMAPLDNVFNPVCCLQSSTVV